MGKSPKESENNCYLVSRNSWNCFFSSQVPKSNKRAFINWKCFLYNHFDSFVSLKNKLYSKKNIWHTKKHQLGFHSFKLNYNVFILTSKQIMQLSWTAQINMKICWFLPILTLPFSLLGEFRQSREELIYHEENADQLKTRSALNWLHVLRSLSFPWIFYYSQYLQT